MFGFLLNAAFIYFRILIVYRKLAEMQRTISYLNTQTNRSFIPIRGKNIIAIITSEIELFVVKHHIHTLISSPYGCILSLLLLFFFAFAYFTSFIYSFTNQAFEELEELLSKNNICIAVKEKLVKDSGVAEEIAYDNIVLKLLTKPRARGMQHSVLFQFTFRSVLSVIYAFTNITNMYGKVRHGVSVFVFAKQTP